MTTTTFTTAAAATTAIPVHIIYTIPKDELWEIDFLQDEMFHPSVFELEKDHTVAIKSSVVADLRQQHPPSSSSVEFYTKFGEKIIFDKNDFNVLVLSTSSAFAGYSNCSNFVDRLNSEKVLFDVAVLLSDEFGDRKGLHNAISKLCKLFLRQHFHASYEEDVTSSSKNDEEVASPVRYIPLGYKAGFKKFSSFSVSKQSQPKKFLWSFVGSVNKQDRKEIIAKLKKDFNSYADLSHFYTNGISTSEMREIYEKSVFVVNMRGWESLNCLRLYEATDAGSIPIVVGSENEICSTFKHENNPPWIIAETWDDAIEKCKILLENPFLLSERQDLLKSWWKTRIDSIRNELRKVFVDKIKNDEEKT